MRTDRATAEIDVTEPGAARGPMSQRGSRFRARRTSAPWLRPRCCLAAQLLLSAIGMASCVRYQAAPISPAETLTAYDARRLESPHLEHFIRERGWAEAWPPASWDLESLTLAALFYSPELDVFRARWHVAEAARVSAGERLNPPLGLSEGYNASAVDATPWIPAATLGLALETAGKRGIRIAEARRHAESVRRELLSAAWKVRSDLRAALVELSLAEQSESLSARRQAIVAEMAALLERQLEIGAVSANEVTQAHLALEEGRVDLLDAEQRRQRAKVELAAALGLPLSALTNSVLDFAGLAELDPSLSSHEARRRAVTERAGVLAALADYEASQEGLRLEIARQYPDLDIGAGYELDQTDSKWTLGLGLVLPVFHRNRGPIAEARARREEAASRLLSLQARVISEVDGALETAASASLRSAQVAAWVDELREREALAQRVHALGEMSRLELLGIELELNSSERSRLDAVAQLGRAVGALEDAMQSPADLDRWAFGTVTDETEETEQKEGTDEADGESRDDG